MFRPLVLVLLVVVAALTVAPAADGPRGALRFHGHRHHLVAAAAGAAIGFYDGIFGPGTGAFLVVALVGLLGYAFLPASATARIVNLATNVGALLVFVPQGAPLWGLGLAMGACNVAGGWLGAHTAIRRGSRFVRVVFLVGRRPVWSRRARPRRALQRTTRTARRSFPWPGPGRNRRHSSLRIGNLTISSTKAVYYA